MIQNGNLRTTAGAGVRPSSRVARSEAIIFTELDGAVVMMDADAGSYYELDPVGARIWALLEPGPTVSEVCAALVAEYEVAPAACAEEVQAFLDELHRLEVLRVLPGIGSREVGNGGAGDPKRLATSDNATALRGRQEPGTRVAWTTPACRVLAVVRTESGDEQGEFESDDPEDQYLPS